MKKWSIILLILLAVSACSTLSRKRNNTTTTAPEEPSASIGFTVKPKLVVGIVVDQMRYDYLTRFDSRYGNDGFKRLINGGFTAHNNHYNFIPTYTAPGHASIFTGTSPMNNGIIGNNWYDKYLKKTIYNASDPNVEPLGTTTDNGRMSPARLLTTTVTDELELHTQGRSKVIGISIKDRGAILPAGHAADAAYWYYGKDQGDFISSTYYMTDLPQWVKDFNASDRVAAYLKDWNTLYPIESYTASGADFNEYERAPRNATTATFPYSLTRDIPSRKKYDIIKSTPYGNSIVADFAMEAITQEQLGQHEDPDFLTVSFSSTDYIGHQYSVNSVEIEDTYLRLDLEIARLLNHLDDKVGKGNYTVFLTADHGAVHNPQYLKSKKIAAGYFNEQEFSNAVSDFIVEKYGNKNLIEKISNDQIFLNAAALKELKLTSATVENAIASHIATMKHIDKVVTRQALLNSSFTHGTLRLIQNGFHPRTSGDVLYTLMPGVISYPLTGSTHGSAQNYDTHVPLIFYGAGIAPGSTIERSEVIDIAPTISTVLGIAFPNGATGNPIKQALRQK